MCSYLLRILLCSTNNCSRKRSFSHSQPSLLPLAHSHSLAPSSSEPFFIQRQAETGNVSVGVAVCVCVCVCVFRRVLGVRTAFFSCIFLLFWPVCGNLQLSQVHIFALTFFVFFFFFVLCVCVCFFLAVGTKSQSHKLHELTEERIAARGTFFLLDRRRGKVFWKLLRWET